MALASSCERIWVIHSDTSMLIWLREHLRKEGILNACFINIEAGLDRLPFRNAQFDAIVIPNLDIVLSWLTPVQITQRVDSLVGEVHRVLRFNGYLFATFRNRRLRELFTSLRSDKEGPTGISPLVLWHSLDCHDFRHRRVYPLLLAGGLVSEALVEKRYNSVRTSFASKERLKELLFRGRFSEHIAPALALVASCHSLPQTALDTLLSDLQRRGLLPGPPQKPSVKRYFVLPGKVILSVGRGLSRFGERIIVLPIIQTALVRRRHEAETLRALRQSGLPIAKLVPEFLVEGSLDGQPYFVQAEIPGISIDRPIRKLDDLTEKATRLLIAFHRSTSTTHTLDEKTFQRFFARSLAALVIDLGPMHEALIYRIEERIRLHLLGLPFKTVWMHGDFKIENLLFDPISFEIRGVIDWDLSQRDGLPLLDLVYLLLFNRKLRTGQSMGSLVTEVLLPLQLLDAERQLMSEYVAALQLSPEVIHVLLGFFWIHHLTLRERVCSEIARSNAVKVLGAVAAHLE